MARVRAFVEKRAFVFHIGFLCFTLTTNSTFGRQDEGIVVTTEDVEAIRKAHDEYQSCLREIEKEFSGIDSDPVQLKEFSSTLAEKLGVKLFYVSLESHDSAMPEMRNSAIASLKSHPEKVRKFFVCLIQTGDVTRSTLGLLSPKQLEAILSDADFSKLDADQAEQLGMARLSTLFVDSDAQLSFEDESEAAFAKQMLKLKTQTRNEFRTQYLKLFLQWPDSNPSPTGRDRLDAAKVFASINLNPEVLNWLVLKGTPNAFDHRSTDKQMLQRAVLMMNHLEKGPRLTTKDIVEKVLKQEIDVSNAMVILTTFGWPKIGSSSRGRLISTTSGLAQRQIESFLSLAVLEDRDPLGYRNRVIERFASEINRADSSNIALLESLASNESLPKSFRRQITRDVRALNVRLVRDKEAKAIGVTTDDIEAIRKSLAEYNRYLDEIGKKFGKSLHDPLQLKKISEPLAEKLGEKLFYIHPEPDEFGLREIKSAAITSLKSHPEKVKQYFVDLIEGNKVRQSPFGPRKELNPEIVRTSILGLLPSKQLEAIISEVDFSKIDLRFRDRDLNWLRALFVNPSVPLQLEDEWEKAFANRILKLEPQQRKDFRSQYLKLLLLCPVSYGTTKGKRWDDLLASHAPRFTPEFLNWTVFTSAGGGGLNGAMLGRALAMMKHLDAEHRLTKEAVIEKATDNEISVEQAIAILHGLGQSEANPISYAGITPRQIESLILLNLNEDQSDPNAYMKFNELARLLSKERGDSSSVSFLTSLANSDEYKHYQSLFLKHTTNLSNRLANQK